jgi:hypothetical protein
MYDTICCPEIMHELMPDYHHFFLKKNLMSMRDLHDLKFENLTGTVKSNILMIFEHFQDCEVIFLKAYKKLRFVIGGPSFVGSVVMKKCSSGISRGLASVKSAGAYTTSTVSGKRDARPALLGVLLSVAVDSQGKFGAMGFRG